MKFLVLASICLFGTQAFASKARVNSLQGADHIVDTQTVFTYPTHIHQLNPYLTFEMGTAGAGAEGGLMRTTANGGKILVYLGHQNTTASVAAPDLRTGNGMLGQNNPLELIYGMNNMAFGLSLSQVDNKKSVTKETTAIAKFGMTMANGSDVYAHLHGVSQAEKGATDKVTAAPYLTLGGNGDSGDLHYFGSLNFGQGKAEISGGDATVKDTNLSLGLSDRSLKTGETDLYYGARIDYAQRDIEGEKITATQLPVFAGIEHPVNSWLTVRASVSQNLFLGSTKDETATNKDEEGIPSNTTVAAGLGFRYNNIILDGSLTAAGDGNINGNKFLSQSSLTYTF